MTRREKLLFAVTPGPLTGITLGTWLRVLDENQFAVAPQYWIRAVLTGAVGAGNSVLRAAEVLRFGRQVRETKVVAPLFILGVWRSGTTHLHNLLARDRRFAYPNLFEVLNPHTFLLTERRAAGFFGRMMPAKRIQDNIALGINEPQEEEVALCAMTGYSVLMGMAFTRRWRWYDQYLTLRDLPPHVRDEWKAALEWFLKKLAFKHGRPLVLKSPMHTGRIRLLLELFPDAKFLHIHRNPYEVFQSSQHTVRAVTPAWALQRRDFRDLEDETIEKYRVICDSYFAERGLIPTERFHEKRFEDLERDPIGELRLAYERLSLPNFDEAAPAVGAYVESLAGYRKNSFADLPERVKARIAEAWGRSFDEWGYAR